MLNINKNTAIQYRFTFFFFYFQLDDTNDFIDMVLNKIKTKASARSIRKIIVDFIIAKEEQIYIVYNNFFEKKRCTMDGLISLILKEGNVPLFLYDFLIILLGDFLNVKIALICAVRVFTNVANVLQQDMNDEEFIIVICQSGTIFTLAGENSDKIRLGVSPLCSFFAKQMGHMNVNVASSHQKHSSIQEASTELTQDGGVPEDSQVVEASTESTQDGGVPEDSQVVEASMESTQDGGVLESQDEELPVSEVSTESTQDGGVLESQDEESQVVEVSTESIQDVGVLESLDEELPVIEASTKSTQDFGVLEELQVVEASTELTQDGVDTNKSNERKSPIVKKTNIDGNASFPSADTENNFDCFVVDMHDASFEMDALDRQLMTLNLNLSSNSIRSETQMKSQAHDVTDSSLDEFTGFHPTDIASSDTETTDNSITISDDEDDDSTSHTTATAEFLDADDNLSNFSNAVLPSVAESDDITVTFSDADGMSEEISIQMVGNTVPPCPDGMSKEISIQTVGNTVPPCHDDSTDNFSDDEIEKKLLLIWHFLIKLKKFEVLIVVVKGWESTQLVLRRKSIPWPKYIRNQLKIIIMRRRQRTLKVTVMITTMWSQMKMRQRILKITVSMEMTKRSSCRDNQMKMRQRILKITVSMEMTKQSSRRNNQTKRRQRILKITVSTEMTKRSSRRDNQMKRRQRILKITVSTEMTKQSSHRDNQTKRRQRILKITVSMEMTKRSYHSDNQTSRSEMTVTTAVMIMDIWTWTKQFWSRP